MKLIHLSDLHLGKRVNECSMLEDQQYILGEILRIIDSEAPDAVLIAGDVYDKSVPSAEAVTLLDDFLVQLASRRVQTCLISGNHDSAERLSFGGRLMDAAGIHIAPVYDGSLAPLTLSDEHGPVDIYLLPFLKPVQVRRFSRTRTSKAIRTRWRRCSVRRTWTQRAAMCWSRTSSSRARCPASPRSFRSAARTMWRSVCSTISIMSPSVTSTARRRSAARPCATAARRSSIPSRRSATKSVTVVEMGEKGSVGIRTVPLVPRRDMSELRGTYNTLMLRENYEGKPLRNDYLHITLTDEEDIPNAVSNLRVVYPNLMRLDYDNARTRAGGVIEGADRAEQKPPLTLFGEFYESQNGTPMSEEQQAFADKLIASIWEEEK